MSLWAISALCACGPYFRHQLLPGGHTYALEVTDLSECNKHDSERSCVSALRARAEQRGRELCGREPNRVHSCEKLVTEQGIAGVSCHVRCEVDYPVSEDASGI